MSHRVRALGVIDLPTIQKKLNLHYFAVARPVRLRSVDQRRQRLQCRDQGPLSRNPDRRRSSVAGLDLSVLKLVDGRIKRVNEPALTALNMRLRDDYTQDCAKGMLRWNKIISLAGYGVKLTLPNVAFHRQIGEFKDVHASPDGVLIDDARLEQPQERMAAVRRGQRLHRLADDPGDRDRRIRRLDLAAQGRHRQQARRFRICEDRDVETPDVIIREGG